MDENKTQKWIDENIAPIVKAGVDRHVAESDIKLPPLLPHPNIAHEGGFHLRPDCQFTVLYKWARSYARAAVEADRAVRDESISLRLATHLFNSGYMAGHDDTVESSFIDIHQSDMETYQNDFVSGLLKELGATQSPAAQEPALPDGWRLVEKKTCYALMNGNDVVATLAGPDARENAVIIANALGRPVVAQPSEAQHDRENLMRAIVEAAIRLGIARADLGQVSGPQCLQLLHDIEEQAAKVLDYISIVEERDHLREVVAAQPSTPEYTSAMGEAAQRYLDHFPHAHPLPSMFRWNDLWDEMRSAAPTPPASEDQK